MRVLGLTFLCIVLMTPAPAQADEVDDLLAGKPVVTGEAAVPVQHFEAPSLQQPIVSPLQSATLADEADWDATIKQAPKRRTSADPPQPARESVPPSDISLVPEPSAIALGVAAILYFLIFFRRRHIP